jgi:hypothetical protein
MCDLRVWINEEMVVFIVIVNQTQIYEITVEVRKVVVGTVRKAGFSELASVRDLLKLWISVKLKDQGEKTDWHKHESDKSRKFTESHV